MVGMVVAQVGTRQSIEEIVAPKRMQAGHMEYTASLLHDVPAVAALGPAPAVIASGHAAAHR